MTIAEDNAFESAVARLPYPVFVVDGEQRLRPMNEDARRLAAEEKLPPLLDRAPSHPISKVVARMRGGIMQGDEDAILNLSGTRYEVIHSTRSAKGEQRWLMLMLRPFPTTIGVNRPALQKRWSLTTRETDVAAAVIAGQTTAEICDSLSISRETLKTHIARLLDKADCENRSQLIAKYLFGQ
jgi:DNA-binding CsgD family transcriptional regulator